MPLYRLYADPAVIVQTKMDKSHHLFSRTISKASGKSNWTRVTKDIIAANRDTIWQPVSKFDGFMGIMIAINHNRELFIKIARHSVRDSVAQVYFNTISHKLQMQNTVSAIHKARRPDLGVMNY